MATVIGQSYVCVDGHICTPDYPGVDTRDMGYQPPCQKAIKQYFSTRASNQMTDLALLRDSVRLS